MQHWAKALQVTGLAASCTKLFWCTKYSVAFNALAWGHFSIQRKHCGLGKPNSVLQFCRLQVTQPEESK